MYAVCMSEMAVVMFEGVGGVMSAAYKYPVTCGDVEYPVCFVCENPVRYDSAAGLTPIFPVITEAGTVEIPVFDRIAKLPAVPSLTGAGPAGSATYVLKLHTLSDARALREVSVAPVMIVAVYTVLRARLFVGAKIAVLFPRS